MPDGRLFVVGIAFAVFVHLDRSLIHHLPVLAGIGMSLAGWCSHVVVACAELPGWSVSRTCLR